jgi:hypothetical protein
VVTEYPALRVSRVKCPGAIGGWFIGRKESDPGVCAGSIGFGAGLGAVLVGAGIGAGAVSELGVTLFVLGGLCMDGLGWLGDGGFCAMTEIGQIRKEKAIFHTVRMRRHGVGRRAKLRFQPAR